MESIKGLKDINSFNPDDITCEDCGEVVNYKPYNYNEEPILCLSCYLERQNGDD